MVGWFQITQVQTVRWWMGHYHAATPKRHYAYANNKAILKIDRGVLQGWKHKDKKVVTAKRYVDGHGKQRYQGTKELRNTETLNSHLT